MILFGHLGITLAAVRLSEKIPARLKPEINIQKIDYRMILIGSILPDLLDKPIIFLATAGKYTSGRVYGHTLIFLLLITLLGIILKSRNGINWLLTISIGSTLHLFLDSMWIYPDTLFWPFYELITTEMSSSLIYWLTSIFNQNLGNIKDLAHTVIDIRLLIPEIIGLSLIITFFSRLIIQKQSKQFLLTGNINK